MLLCSFELHLNIPKKTTIGCVVGIRFFFQPQKISFLKFEPQNFLAVFGYAKFQNTTEKFSPLRGDFSFLPPKSQNILCFFPDFKNFLPVLNPKRKNPGFPPFLAEKFPNGTSKLQKKNYRLSSSLDDSRAGLLRKCEQWRPSRKHTHIGRIRVIL